MSAPKAREIIAKSALHREYRRRFFRSLAKALCLVIGLIAIALTLGILGYHYIARFSWVDSLLNASMILSGMGPVGTLDSSAAKIFASAYALFSGVMFISASGIILSPIFHRVLHRFHLEQKDA